MSKGKVSLIVGISVLVIFIGIIIYLSNMQREMHKNLDNTIDHLNTMQQELQYIRGQMDGARAMFNYMEAEGVIDSTFVIDQEKIEEYFTDYE